MDISVIIVTYNRPDALEAILGSILRQTVLPGEVVIADDGSEEATRELAEKFRNDFPVDLVHVWHEDRGFRLAAIRNRAIKASKGEYLVFSDGDLLFHPRFIEDYSAMAQPGNASIGSRLFLSREATENILRKREIPATLPFYFRGIEKNRLNAVRIPFLTGVLPSAVFSERLRGGLLGVWRDDLEKVNGWNEAFSGWGLEDTEVVARLYHSGIKLRKLKFAGVTWHLWHPGAGREQLEENRQLLRHTLEKKLTWCEKGLVRSGSL